MKQGKGVYIAGIIVFILALFIGFFFGRAYQEHKTILMRPFQKNFSKMGRGGTGMQRKTLRAFQAFGVRGRITGQITKVSGNTVTILEPNGTSQTVTLSGTTTYIKTTQSSLSDLKVGEMITVGGQATNGSVSAQTVQITVAQ